MPVGRYAPSPTASLHLGNLRTALLAWLFARADGSRFHLRFEDLDGAVRPEHEASQIDDLIAIGVDWDGIPMRQTDRLAVYGEVIQRLIERDLTYPCYCSRREIREATQAPNRPAGAARYPGTCRRLTSAQRAEREATGRPPALRIMADAVDARPERSFDDLLCGSTVAPVDDFVIRRNDGMPAYNLIVVVDDAAQNVQQVVRADDILDSTGRQILIHEILDLSIPSYAHVPLVLAPTGKRLAKRDGATTLADRVARGETAASVRSDLLASVGLGEAGQHISMDEALERFDPARLPRQPTTLTIEQLAVDPLTRPVDPAGDSTHLDRDRG